MFSRKSEFSALEQSMASWSSKDVHKRQILYKLEIVIVIAFLFRANTVSRPKSQLQLTNFRINLVIWFSNLHPNGFRPLVASFAVNRIHCLFEIHRRHSIDFSKLHVWSFDTHATVYLVCMCDVSILLRTAIRRNRGGTKIASEFNVNNAFETHRIYFENRKRNNKNPFVLFK